MLTMKFYLNWFNNKWRREFSKASGSRKVSSIHFIQTNSLHFRAYFSKVFGHLPIS